MPENPQSYGLNHQNWRPGQYEIIQSVLNSTSQSVVLEAPTGCHRLGQGILMYDGTVKNVEDIVVGDRLMGWNSEYRTVLRTITGAGNMVTVTPVKGDPFVVNEDHVLTLMATGGAKMGGIKIGDIVDVSVKEYFTWSKYKKHVFKLFRVPVFFGDSFDLPLDPYAVGIFIGDGSVSKSCSITINDKDTPLIEYISSLANDFGANIRSYPDSGASRTYTISTDRGKENLFLNVLREIELFGKRSEDKFIPFEYKTASRIDRMNLLAGLLDTDGSYDLSYDYITKSSQLADDIVFLCRSLGLACYKSKTTKSNQYGFTGDYYRLSISGNLHEIPNRIDRRKASPRLQKKNVLVTGFSITKLPIREIFYGFELDGDGRYLLDDFTVTHNSGKTGVATALGRDHKIIALCRTKNLQIENYEKTYGFDALFGKANYLCAHPKFAGSYADKCAYNDEGMHKCPYAADCEYLVRKSAAIRSQRASLNYAYFLSARWPSDRGNGVEYLVMDEAHQLSDLVLEHAGTDISERVRRTYGLPSFPSIGGGTSMFMKEVDPIDASVEWLDSARSSLLKIINSNPTTEDERSFARRAESLYNKFAATINAMRLNPNYWFIRSGATAGKDADGSFVPRFVAKPLTARYHFNSYFSGAPHRVLMSATIGNTTDFTGELGISEFQYLSVPNQWGIDTRPVLDLKAPRMGRSAGESEYNRQAQIIAKAILDCPPNWSGIIHVTRKSEASILARRLERYGLSGRMWTPDEKWGTDIQIREWYLAKKKRPGLIAVSWTWHEGVDLTEERICIAAKVQFPYLGDSFEQERMRYSNRTYLWRTATALEQSLGRTRRGEPEDYDLNGKREQLVAIADGNWTRVKSALSASFLESIVSV